MELVFLTIIISHLGMQYVAKEDILPWLKYSTIFSPPLSHTRRIHSVL